MAGVAAATMGRCVTDASDGRSANLRPFYTVALNSLAKALLKGSVGLFIWLAAGAGASAQTIPCQVRLVFETEAQRGQQVEYKLFLQLKNITAQPVQTVSVLWLDRDENVIGNSHADCRFAGQGLGLSQTGQCTASIQQINQRWMDRLGQTIWTEMVNSELEGFKRINSCKVVGYRH